jgi:hypothetical protein
MDSAFYNQDIISIMDQNHVKFTASVPFERFVQFKEMIEQRKRWFKIDEQRSILKPNGNPNLGVPAAVLCLRAKDQKGSKRDLYNYICLNHATCNLITRSLQPIGLIGEKRDYVSLWTRIPGSSLRQCKNRYSPGGYYLQTIGRQSDLYPLCDDGAHNMSCQIQMLSKPPALRSLVKRPSAWAFEKLDTLRHRLIQRAGRLGQP